MGSPGRHQGMHLHLVVASERLGRDVLGLPLWRVSLDCGHTVERVIRSFVPKRTRCNQCQPEVAPSRTQPSGLVPPRCVGCKVHAVARRFGTVPPKRGWREAGGVHWNWYCSEECAARALGRGNAGKKFRLGAQVTKTRATARALERLTAACKAYMEPDGRVPVQAMVKVFMLERRAWYANGRDAGYLSATRERVSETRSRERRLA